MRPVDQLHMDVPSRPRGWRLIDVTYSCVPDAVYPWDPAVLRAIWEFDPEVVPVWEKWIFMPPLDDSSSDEVLVVGRHCVARHKPTLVNEAYPFLCEMPTMPCQGVVFQRPNVLEFVLADGNKEEGTDLPGPYVAWDWNLWRLLRELYNPCTDGQKLGEEYIEREVQRREASKKSVRDDLRARDEDWRKHEKKRLEKISDVEWAEFYRSGGAVDVEKKISVSVPEAPSESGLPALSQGV
jgi:hypothetical protein